MKTEFKAKFLQHLNKKKKDGGFTLIELLVVIIIIGILAAIALPSFLNQASKAKQSEAKNNVGAVNRAQQAFYLEKQKFATDFGPLKIGIPTKTDNYEYNIKDETDEETKAVIKATPQANALLGYGGLVEIDDGQTFAAACQSDPPDGATKADARVPDKASGTPKENCGGNEDNVMK
jgi:type IV pilus assembly protein PilA